METGSAVRIVSTAAQAEDLAAHVLASHRQRPIVAVTTNRRDGAAFVDVQSLAERLRDSAEVVVVETGPATWALTASLPPRFDVYGGALRLWKPGVRVGAQPYDHPWLLVDSREKALRAVDRLLREFDLVELTPPVQVGVDVEAMVTQVNAREALVDVGGVAARVAKSGLAAGLRISSDGAHRYQGVVTSIEKPVGIDLGRSN